MTARLRDASHPVVAFDTAHPERKVDGFALLPSARTLAQQIDAVLVCVPDDRALAASTRSDDGALHGMRPGQLLINFSMVPIGAGRLGLAPLVVLAIRGGLLAGLVLTGTAFPSATPGESLFGRDMLAAGVAVAAYGSSFDMPWRLMPASIMAGMAAHALRWQLWRHGASAQLGAFGAAPLVSGIVAPLAYRFRGLSAPRPSRPWWPSFPAHPCSMPRPRCWRPSIMVPMHAPDPSYS